MRIPIGIICSVLGATIAFYLAIVTLVTLPSDGTLRWFAIVGIAALSLIAGILINGISMQDFFKVSRAYDSLTSRLSPLLYSGIEDLLHRWKKTIKSGEDLNFRVAAPINGFFRSVGATYPAEDPYRQLEMKFGEGLTGFLADRKAAGYTRSSSLSLPKVEANRRVFDRAGGLLGEIPPLQEADRWKIHVDEKWIYIRPIFEKSTATPWSNRLVGLLEVHSSADEADSLFKTPEFQHLLDSVAAEVSPYLDAIQVLVAEGKV